MAKYRFQMVSKEEEEPFLPTRPLSMPRVVINSICRSDKGPTSQESKGIGVETDVLEILEGMYCEPVPGPLYEL
jgi:hypothetical protein